MESGIGGRPGFFAVDMEGVVTDVQVAGATDQTGDLAKAGTVLGED